MRVRRPAGWVWVVAAAAIVCASPAWADDLKLVADTTAIGYQRSHRNEDLAAWKKRVPQVELIQVRSSADGSQQPALFFDSVSDRPRPLLVVLHSWSADYQQNLDIPFAEFAIANDWVFIHPNFRGANKRPEATASELAGTDVIDAVKLASRRAAVDPSRIYLVGYSGGAMQALVLAGKHPEVWAGVAAWGPVFDIAEWYFYDHGKDGHYRQQIADSCGGVPRPGSAAERECRQRSPLASLAPAAGRVPVLIAHGIRDHTVPPHHALCAYDALAAPQDRFSDGQRSYIDARGKVPRELAGFGAGDRLFDKVGAPLRLRRQSQAVTLVLFQGGHDMIYNPTLRWLSEQRRSSAQASLAHGDQRGERQ